MHEERKLIKVVTRAASYGGGWSGFPGVTTRYRKLIHTLVFYFPANGSTNPGVL